MLKDFLEKLGVKDFSELTNEEQETYQRWQDTLDKPNLTIEDIIAWLKSEDQLTQAALIDYTNDGRKQLFLQATSRLVRMLTAILTKPEQEREMLKQQIEQMLKK